MSFGAVAGAVIGGVISADAAGNAADAQKDAANQTNATNRAMSRQQMQLQEPFREAGLMGNNRLLHLLGLQSEGDTAALDSAFESIYQKARSEGDASHRAQYGFGFDDAPAWAKAGLDAWDDNLRTSAKKQAKEQLQASGGSATGDDFGSLLKNFSNEDFEKDPGYQFRMDEGMRGVEGGAAARGGLLSGAAMKAIQKYGQGFASNEYGNAYSRYTNDQTNNYNRLAGLVNSGQGATNQISNTAGQFAQNNANAMGAYGNAQAAGYMGQANALNNGIGQATNLYQQNQLMDLIRNPGGGGFGGGSSWGGLNNQYFSGNSGMGG